MKRRWRRVGLLGVGLLAGVCGVQWWASRPVQLASPRATVTTPRSEDLGARVGARALEARPAPGLEGPTRAGDFEEATSDEEEGPGVASTLEELEVLAELAHDRQAPPTPEEEEAEDLAESVDASLLHPQAAAELRLLGASPEPSAEGGP
ncbi:MAG: hypothetical protein ACXU86_13515 [Archangium sp.]